MNSLAENILLAKYGAYNTPPLLAKLNIMRVIEIHHSAGLYDLMVSKQAMPTPGPHQVLIKIVAAGVNRPDIMQCKGVYPPPPGASSILGLEVAGEVVEVGCEVRDFKNGDRICALVNGGGYAEYCLASASCCLPIPKGFSYIAAAGLPETFFTVWSNVYDQARLQAGERLLVHGGTSGIGTTAIQLAKALGSQVLITAGSDEKCQRCLDLCADLAINYHKQDFVEAVLDHTAGEGVDVILDMIGGDYLPRNLKCLRLDGRLQLIALQHGSKSDINLASLLMKRLTIAGSTLRPRNDAFKAKIARQLYAKVWPLLESGQINPVIDSVFQLSQAIDAHRLMESNRHIGKIILEI